MQLLQVLHLSDLHIQRKKSFVRSVGPKCDQTALQAIAEIAYRDRDRFDAILISGDIADLGWEYDLRHAIDFFDLIPEPRFHKPWLSSNGEPTLKAFGKPIIIVPGNHDRYINITGIPKGIVFDEKFSSYWNAGYGGIQPYFLPDKQSPILAIICGDFTLEKIEDSSLKKGGHWGQGKIYETRLMQLIQITKKVTSSHIAVIWMIHFAPDFPNLRENLQLLDADKLIKAAAKAGVRHIFCGHTHQSDCYKPESSEKVNIHCAGTSTVTYSNALTSIHIRNIKIDRDHIIEIKSVEYIYNKKDGIFL